MKLNECAIREELWIGYIRGTLDAASRQMLTAHLERCGRCRDIYAEWNALLNETQPHDVPPARLARRLKFSVVWHGRVVRLLRNVRAPVYATAAALAFVFGVWALTFGPARNQTTVPYAVAEEKMLEDMSLIKDARTKQVNVMPLLQPDVRGIAWINDESDEVMLLVEGLRFENDKDYQVWSVVADSRRNIGLMRWTNGKAHMYYRGTELSEAERLTVSREPKGGSGVPTGPDLMVVRLRH